ncbi:conserved hypothetical protein [Candidatus Brocadia pituitae]|nr:conserved hypothetical protein [Candidatus Brocadia pituitae]
MVEQIKSGQEILDEFFSQIGNIEGVDKNVAQTVLRLYQEGKLTNTNLSNDLSTIREKKEYET